MERRATEDHRPERWKPPDVQAEDLQEAGRMPLISGNSPVTLEGIEPFGLGGVAKNADAEERYQSRALHMPWPTVPLASNPLAGLRAPPPPSSRR